MKSSSKSKHITIDSGNMGMSWVTRENLKKFQKKYLANDGYVMLHIIKSVGGDIVFMELLYEIWIDFVNNDASSENSNDNFEEKDEYDEKAK